MGNLKFDRSVEQLWREPPSNKEGVKLKANGGSMGFLICDGDEVSLVIANHGKIMLGDIIVYLNKSKMLHIMHRVVRKGKSDGKNIFQTKGDWELYPDEFWVNENEVICKLKRISKFGFDLDIEYGFGRIISIVVGKASSITLKLLSKISVVTVAGLIKEAVFKLLRFAKPESECSYDLQMFLLNVNYGVEIDKWLTGVKLVQEYTEDIKKRSLKVCEVQLEGGYSEEAMSLVRNGVSVDSMNVFNESKTSSQYDYILASRVINALFNPESRVNALNVMFTRLKPGGCVVFSCLTQRGEYLTNFKRMFWSLLGGSEYKGPRPHSVVDGEHCIRRNVTFKNLNREIKHAGFSLKKHIEKNGVLVVVAVK
jgi:hypothetical protein